MWETILFDLDGTMTDPKQGITTAVSEALSHFGIHEDPDNLTQFIGPPLGDAFQEYYGLTPAQAEEAIGHFRVYFDRQGWRENIPYPGIADLLAALQRAGRRLIVATSKPELFANRIMEYFDLSQYFTLICGAPMHNQAGAKKAVVIGDALRRAGIAADAAVVMVGDRRHDIEGAHQVGLPAIGVLYGYGSREEHERCGADYLAEDLCALRALLIPSTKND